MYNELESINIGEKKPKIKKINKTLANIHASNTSKS